MLDPLHSRYAAMPVDSASVATVAPLPLPLPPERLRADVDPASLPFATTADLDPLDATLGQDRAAEAIRFGLAMRRDGYHLFVLGPDGTGRHTMVRRELDRTAAGSPAPADWCYVYNFREPDRPRAIALPAGRGRTWRADMQHFGEDVVAAINAVFDSDEFRSRVDEIAAEFGEREAKAFQALGARAEPEGIALIRTPAGFGFAPVANGEVVSPEDFEKLPEPERKRLQETIGRLQGELQRVIHQVPQWGRERRARLRAVVREFTAFAVRNLIEDLKARYADVPVVVEHLGFVATDIVENAERIRPPHDGTPDAPEAVAERTAVLRRYHVNLLVDRTETRGVPVVVASDPSFQNLIGRVEHYAQFGALLTDFTLIKAGALHEANGGYLLIDAAKVLTQPFAWESLKRALSMREIRITSLAQMYSLAATVSLDPERIPLDVKVVLFGERDLYYLLHAFDPEFQRLFKVPVDMEDAIPRSASTQIDYARLLAALAAREGLLPFDRDAVARAIERGARLAEDAGKLTAHLQSVVDLLHEADLVARSRQLAVVDAACVEAALAAQRRRVSRIRDRIAEETLRGTLVIETSGARVGQVNGLSVHQLPGDAFGTPTRITASVSLGAGQLVDIQREVKLGGAIHSKGVLILAAYLSGRFGTTRPLAISASLVFEQTYGMVDGDSASVAELCALLSALSGVPIDQSFALTGAVSQHGDVLAIGGVNEKIEGFFDLCAARGLTGSQGVLIPASNVQHLMLDRRVVDAVRDGRFRIVPVATVDEALSLLTGVPAGAPDAGGAYPDGSVHARVTARLDAFHEARRAAAPHPPVPTHDDD
jgi:lon-related putative ATP-dependent protease